MRHNFKRPLSRTNLPTVAEGAEQSQEESQQQQQQQQLQESRSLLSNILTRRSNSQRNNLASSSSASAPQNDNGGSGTEAAQGKRKSALSFLPRRRSSQRSGLTASSAPQPNEVGHHEPAPVNNDVVAPTSLPSSPTLPTPPRLLGGLSRLPSSASQLCRHLCKTAGKLPNVLPRRRRADGDDSHPLLDEDEAEEAMLNEDYPRIEIDDPLHVDGFFRPDERGRIRAIVPPRNKDDDPVVSIRFTLTGVITR